MGGSWVVIKKSILNKFFSSNTPIHFSYPRQDIFLEIYYTWRIGEGANLFMEPFIFIGPIPNILQCVNHCVQSSIRFYFLLGPQLPQLCCFDHLFYCCSIFTSLLFAFLSSSHVFCLFPLPFSILVAFLV